MGTSVAVLLSYLAVAVGVGKSAVVIVSDPTAIRRSSGVRMDRTFTLTKAEAKMPRDALPRYLDAELGRAKTDDRKTHLREIASVSEYSWHCGGYVRGGERYVFCTFGSWELNQEVGLSASQLGLAAQRFPVRKDRGIAEGRCHFSLKRGQIVRLE